ncbi:MAG TPA: hypothetical protein VFQ79_05050 [Bryobacteraceae bacterium]|nr:hypothetical protein [Bryobacteraceae bacterium]
MNIRVHGGQGLSLDEMGAFLQSSSELSFQGQSRQEIYGWVDQTLRQQHYERLGRTERGLIRQYVAIEFRIIQLHFMLLMFWTCESSGLTLGHGGSARTTSGLPGS